MNKISRIIPVVVCAVALMQTAGSPRAESPPFAQEDAARAIGPGKVRLSLTPAGGWVALHTVWDRDRSLITGGGIAVFAAGADGGVVKIADTADGMVASSSVLFRHAFEGAEGGFRAPAPRPDDDGDGLVDEDRMDGLDNDGDGRIDEDFAAIGDEMIVSAYRTRDGAPYSLNVHQELYAWSLPHIEGAVMASLTITNAGSADIEGLRVAAYYHREGPLDVARQQFGNIVTVPSASSIALVPFTRSHGPWRNGVVVSDGAIAHDLEAEPPGADPGAQERVLADRVTVYTATPSMGRLTAGASVRIDFALVATPPTAEAAEAATRALETFNGDGQHAYLPPPVSIRPRVLWGTYRALPEPDGGVWLDFDVIGQHGVTAEDFSHFSGVEPGVVGSYEVSPGRRVLAIRGEQGAAILRKGDSMTLKGRLESGEFFEAHLRPHRKEVAPELHREAEAFWSTPGRLTQQLLKASPNPFRDATVIGYEIPAAIEQEDGSLLRFGSSYETTVKVYNVAGRLVSTLVDRVAGPGTYTIDWPAVDDSGNPVASGVYYIKLQIENRFLTQRLIFLK